MLKCYSGVTSYIIRASVLQELTSVQASLDESYSTAADAHLNILDLSSSHLAGIEDTSELKNYILAAKQQVEMMQNKRAKTNIEYSRKITEMERLVKERTGVSATHLSQDAAIRKAQSTSSSDYISTTTGGTEFANLPDQISSNSSFSHPGFQLDTSANFQPRYPISGSNLQPGVSANQYKQLTSASGFSNGLHLTPRLTPPVENGYASPHTHNLSSGGLPSDFSDIEGSDVPDSLSLKVRSLTNSGRGTSTPKLKLSPRELTEDRSAMKGTAGSVLTLESENAALRAELHIINSDRSSLHQVAHCVSYVCFVRYM